MVGKNEDLSAPTPPFIADPVSPTRTVVADHGNRIKAERNVLLLINQEPRMTFAHPIVILNPKAPQRNFFSFSNPPPPPQTHVAF